MKGKIKFLELEGEKLVPVVVQDTDGNVLMLAYMNQEALQKTVETGYVHFWSRSRKKLWKKGETSGNVLELEEIRIDCDNDALLVIAKPTGPVCHTGNYSCFFRNLKFRKVKDGGKPFGFLNYLQGVLEERKKKLPAKSYTAWLFKHGKGTIGRKFFEEATETFLAYIGYGDLRAEAADLIYHLLVLLTDAGLEWQEVIKELKKRHKNG